MTSFTRNDWIIFIFTALAVSYVIQLHEGPFGMPDVISTTGGYAIGLMVGALLFTALIRYFKKDAPGFKVAMVILLLVGVAQLTN
ncbi:MAG: hypothetical protein K2P94_17205 [Rhodospirillaceae bacterium]|nr:hypothetical protein [Rhodospirillaceae bacterium]